MDNNSIGGGHYHYEVFVPCASIVFKLVIIYTDDASGGKNVGKVHWYKFLVGGIQHFIENQCFVCGLGGHLTEGVFAHQF